MSKNASITLYSPSSPREIYRSIRLKIGEHAVYITPIRIMQKGDFFTLFRNKFQTNLNFLISFYRHIKFFKFKVAMKLPPWGSKNQATYFLKKKTLWNRWGSNMGLFPHSTVILKEYFENIPLKSCNIAKIFINLLEFLKYCRNLEMSVQNIINGILLQY